MPVPTHRDGCKTTMFPTKCPDCGDAVFYFSWTCGSRVFFDLPEPPWNPHEDRCIPYLLRYMLEIERVLESQVRGIIHEYSKISGVPIPSQVLRRLNDLDGRVSNRLIVQEVPPQDQPRSVLGTIFSVAREVNFFRRFNYADNAMGRGLLGKLLRESYVEITIREDADENNRSSQFRAFQKLIDFDRSGLGQHSRVTASFVTYTIPDGRRIWLIQGIESVA